MPLFHVQDPFDHPLRDLRARLLDEGADASGVVVQPHWRANLKVGVAGLGGGRRQPEGDQMPLGGDPAAVAPAAGKASRSTMVWSAGHTSISASGSRRATVTAAAMAGAVPRTTGRARSSPA